MTLQERIRHNERRRQAEAQTEALRAYAINHRVLGFFAWAIWLFRR